MSAEGTPALNDGLDAALAQANSDGGAVEPSGQPRDPATQRFMPKEASEPQERPEPAPEAAQGNEDRTGWIPAWRAKEIADDKARAIAEERDTIRREFDQFRHQQAEAARPKRVAPDLIADPEGFQGFIGEDVDQRIGTVEQRMQARWIDMTCADAEEQHGEAFVKAWDAVASSGDRALIERIKDAPNPAKAAMKWHASQEALRETGGDLGKYREKLRAEFKKDPEFRKEFMADLEAEARGGDRSSTNVTNLPSLNRTPGGAGNQRPGALGGSDAEIYASLTSKRR